MRMQAHQNYTTLSTKHSSHQLLEDEEANSKYRQNPELLVLVHRAISIRHSESYFERNP